MPPAKPIAVRDKRELGFFRIDNEVLDNYPSIGPYAILVYMVLCRHAGNSTGECWLNRLRIAEQARISASSADRGLRELVAAGLVTISRKDNHSPNEYALNIVKKRLLSEVGVGVPKQTQGASPVDEGASLCESGASPIDESINKEFELDLSNKTKPTPTPSDEGVIQQVFKFYVEKLGKSSIYELTPKRLAMALARFRESVKKNNGCRKTAQEWLEIAVEQMQGSDFHMGRDKRFPGKVHTDWELLFRSPDKFNSWLEKSHE